MLSENPELESSVSAQSPNPLWVTFFGTSTLLFSLDTSQILIDGFFTRPSRLTVLLGKINPDHQKIALALRLAGITRLDAVLVGHSHYDHALDAPDVSAQTGALLIGSSSTRNIALGFGLPESKTYTAMPLKTIRIGSFQTTFIPAPHSSPDLFPGNITHPLHPPARAAQYREGGTSSIWIETSSQNLLVVGSAGFIPGGLCDVRAGSVFLSVASIARKGPVWIEKYFAECVLTVQAKQVFPIHWDDFTRPAREPLPPIPTWIDPVRRSMDQIEALCDRHQIQFSQLTYQQPLILTP